MRTDTIQTLTKITSIYTYYSAKLVPKKSNETQNCVLKLDLTIKNLLWDFFSISILGLGFSLKKGWEMGFRLPFRTLLKQSN